jgi:hypothetical protein
MAEWQAQDLKAYRERLLKGGVSYAKVRRHLAELRDHHRELRQEAQARGLDAAAAEVWASTQLGSLEQIGDHMLPRAGMRGLWQRYRWYLMALLLPVLAYLLSLHAVLLLVIAVVEATKALLGEAAFNTTHPGWMDSAWPLLRAFLLYVLAPLWSLLLIRRHLRQRVPFGYVVVGVLVLSWLGASTNFMLSWPDAAALEPGMIGATVARGEIPAYGLRLCANLLLSALGWYWWNQRYNKGELTHG